MKIVIFAHPEFISSQSMPRYAGMLADGMKQRGHEVSIWQPSPLFFNGRFPGSLKKWLGYIDQYIVFPLKTRRRIKQIAPDTIFIFADQALGPWVPLVKNRLHVIHCHDFLAQRSALGEFPQNRVSFSGRLYQSYIRRGYRKGKNFISVSYKTKSDLHKFLNAVPSFSEVIYNGLNPRFNQMDSVHARELLSQKLQIILSDGYILHVGGNQWYKNRAGVIEIYGEFRKQITSEIPLLLVGVKPSDEIKQAYMSSPYKEQIHFITEMDDIALHYAYAGASVFLFPSFAEGFGWPIAEAMASGCPVITTNEMPMTEVAGSCAYFVPPRPVRNKKKEAEWSSAAANIVVQVIQMDVSERQQIIQTGLKNIERFNAVTVLNQIESAYKDLHNQKN